MPVPFANEYLSEYLQPIRDKNNDRIRNYIKMNEPKYRPLAKHRSHWFDNIRPGISDEELSVELYRLSRDYDLELLAQRPRRHSTNAERNKATSETISSRKRQFNSFLTEWNDQGMAKLADYVIHRKATLEILEESLALLDSGEKYAAEEQIHRLICPMKTTSDDVPAEQMNLWIIDERLAFHNYLASDQPMNSIEEIDSDRTDRGDLILFNRALSFADKEFSSVVIIEFKRPMRDDYTEKENPIQQVYNYVRTIREAKQPLSAKGRPLPKLDTVPFFAYIICDITPKLRDILQDREFIGSADGETFYRFHDGHKIYIEVMSFTRLHEDSTRRNQAFFEKLNLHMNAADIEKPREYVESEDAGLGQPSA